MRVQHIKELLSDQDVSVCLYGRDLTTGEIIEEYSMSSNECFWQPYLNWFVLNISPVLETHVCDDKSISAYVVLRVNIVLDADKELNEFKKTLKHDDNLAKKISEKNEELKEIIESGNLNVIDVREDC